MVDWGHPTVYCRALEQHLPMTQESMFLWAWDFTQELTIPEALDVSDQRVKFIEEQVLAYQAEASAFQVARHKEVSLLIVIEQRASEWKEYS